MVEHPNAVSEQDRCNADKDLVQHACVEALARNVGAEDGDVFVTRGSLGGSDPAFQVTDEGDTRDRSVGDVVGKHELRS